IGGGNKFFAFVNLYSDQAYIGSILIELVQQRIQSSSVFPKLLLDNKYAENLNIGNFDYAVFLNKDLQFSIGSFNYRNPKVDDLFSQNSLFTTGVFQNDYHHLGVENENNIILVSSPAYPNNYVLADVALYFVTYLLLTLLTIFIYSLFIGINNFRFNYATKLQFYLNFAFFFPMLVISVITVGFLSNTYR